MAKDGAKRSFWAFWTTLPGVVTAFAALIAAITGLLTLLFSAGIIGGVSQPAAESQSSVNGTPAQSLGGVSATGESAAGDISGRWSNASLGFLYFERTSAVASGYEFQEYDKNKSVIGSGNALLEGDTVYIQFGYNNFIGEYTGELAVTGNRMRGTIKAKFGGESTIDLTRDE